MASLGDSEGTFSDITAGTATGLSIDRDLSTQTGGMAAGEDLDAVAEGDYWRQNFRRRPYDRDIEDELERGWDARHGDDTQKRKPLRDASGRVSRDAKR